ncbi:MAG: hypothetical protein IT462_03570 [Planctomycetes bacterium]|nr:hypothetical protein [Planctomycetota bacterium]
MVDQERLLLRLAKKHLTRCPYCAKDYAEFPFPKVKQFRCLGCSAFISSDMLVEDIDDEVFDRDTTNVCRHCGYHWSGDEAVPPSACPGCGETCHINDLITEREFAGQHTNFAPQANLTGSNARGVMIVVATLVLFLAFGGLFLRSCSGL